MAAKIFKVKTVHFVLAENLSEAQKVTEALNPGLCTKSLCFVTETAYTKSTWKALCADMKGDAK